MSKFETILLFSIRLSKITIFVDPSLLFGRFCKLLDKSGLAVIYMFSPLSPTRERRVANALRFIKKTKTQFLVSDSLYM